MTQSAASVIVGMKCKATITLTDDGSNPAATESNRKPIFSNWDKEETLNGSTTPDCDVCYFAKVTLSGGSATLDLTSIAATDGETYSASGKKLVFFRIYNPGSNSVNLAPGASNAFTSLFGSGNDIDVLAGEEVMKRVRLTHSNPNTAVSGSVKEIDFSGTGTDYFELTLGFGD